MFSQGFKSPMGDAASPVAVFRNVGDSGVIFDQRPDLNTAKVSQLSMCPFDARRP